MIDACSDDQLAVGLAHDERRCFVTAVWAVGSDVARAVVAQVARHVCACATISGDEGSMLRGFPAVGSHCR
jgi:hypothetical protein